MRIQIVSDLHLETRPQQKSLTWADPSVDLVIIAGDATDYPTFDSLQLLADRTPGLSEVPIIRILGNHEFYRSPGVDTVLERLKTGLGDVVAGQVRSTYQDTFTIAPRAFKGLESKTELKPGSMSSLRAYEDSPITFICATLWSDISDPMDYLYASGINDFRVPGLTKDWYIEQHNLHKEYIRSQLEQLSETDQEVVVVTHHAPTRQSVAERYRGDPLTPCFSSELSEMILQYQPLAWIHGHTHDSFDYMVGETRVVCNPNGYPGERTPRDFKHRFILDL